MSSSDDRKIVRVGRYRITSLIQSASIIVDMSCKCDVRCALLRSITALLYNSSLYYIRQMPTRILTHLKTILVYFHLFFSLHHHACLPLSLSLVSCTCFRLSTSNSVCLWSHAHVSVCLLLQIWSVAYVCVTLYHLIGWYPSWCIHSKPVVCTGFSLVLCIRNVGTPHAGLFHRFLSLFVHALNDIPRCALIVSY
jgi:hypothetical protein